MSTATPTGKAPPSGGTWATPPQTQPSKTVQRVIRQPNGQLRVVSAPSVAGGAAPGTSGAGTAGSGGVGAATGAGGANSANTLLQQKLMGLQGGGTTLMGMNGVRAMGGGIPPTQRPVMTNNQNFTLANPQLFYQQIQQNQQRNNINLNNNKNAMGRLNNPQTLKMLRIVRNIALLVVGVAILNVIGNNAGALPMVLATYVLYKIGFFVLLEDMLGKLKSALTGDEAAYEMALRRADSMRAPVTRKEGSISQRSETISYGFSCMQGWRRSMEDAHTMILDGVKHDPHLHTPPPLWRINTAPSLGTIHNQGVKDGKGGFFAVFDGHCGPRVAHYCSEHLYHFVCKSAAWARKDYKEALVDGFVTMDQHLYNSNGEERSGCTAVAVLISEDGKKLYCANAGDSRAIVGQEREGAVPLTASSNTVTMDDACYAVGNGFMAISADHKPYNKIEQLRIQRAGGIVFNKRVNGILALSRAIGDFSFKKNKTVPWVDQAVTCMPDVREYNINLEQDQFIVIACDGIWDVRTNEDVAAFVRLRLKKKIALHTICEQLMHACLSNRPFGNGCDNMSVIIVTLDQSAFMKKVGGACAGPSLSPAVRPSASPISSPIRSVAGSPNAAGIAVPPMESLEDKALPPQEAATESSVKKSNRRTPPPALVSASAGTNNNHTTVGGEAKGQGEEEAVLSIASPSARAINAGFPSATTAPIEEATEETDPMSTDTTAAACSEPNATQPAEGEEDEEEARKRKIHEALSDAEVFSPKTPPALRELSGAWPTGDDDNSSSATADSELANGTAANEEDGEEEDESINICADGTE